MLDVSLTPPPLPPPPVVFVFFPFQSVCVFRQLPPLSFLRDDPFIFCLPLAPYRLFLPPHPPSHHHTFFSSSLPLFFPLCFPLLGPNPLFWPSGQIFSSISPQCEVTQSAPITVLVTEINNLLALQLELQKRLVFLVFFFLCVCLVLTLVWLKCDSPVCRAPAAFLPAHDESQPPRCKDILQSANLLAVGHCS